MREREPTLEEETPPCDTVPPNRSWIRQLILSLLAIGFERRFILLIATAEY
jgi:hypothetical protein